jgi:hypothetical protein
LIQLAFLNLQGRQVVHNNILSWKNSVINDLGAVIDSIRVSQGLWELLRWSFLYPLSSLADGGK